MEAPQLSDPAVRRLHAWKGGLLFRQYLHNQERVISQSKLQTKHAEHCGSLDQDLSYLFCQPQRLRCANHSPCPRSPFTLLPRSLASNPLFRDLYAGRRVTPFSSQIAEA